MAEAQKGAIEYGDPTILPAICTLDAPTTAAVGVGEVIAVPTQAAPLFFGVMGEKDGVHGDTVAVGVNKHFRVRKQAPQVLAKLDYITFRLVAATDYYEADVAASTDVVYGQVITAALSADTTVHIHGPFFSAGNTYYTVP